MKLETRKLVTIVTEAIIESSLLREIEALGVRGYTVTEAHGKGGTGTRDAAWQQSGNIRIEILCSLETAHKIASFVKDEYFDRFAMVLFMSDVEVLRSHKF
jgi:nitrogen regulatory protein PII